VRLCGQLVITCGIKVSPSAPPPYEMEKQISCYNESYSIELVLHAF